MSLTQTSKTLRRISQKQ